MKVFIGAFFEWLPGVVVGMLPLFAFVLATGFGTGALGVEHFQLGLTSHLMVMAIVTSSVSLVTSWVRVGAGHYPNFAEDGRGPTLLALSLVLVAAYSLVIYALAEAGVRDLPMRTCALLAVGAALLASISMEFAMARLRLLSAIRNGRETTPL